MTYANRMTLAAILSVLLHIVVFGVLQVTYVPRPNLPPPVPEPIVLNLQPEPPPLPPAPRQLVDVSEPAPPPPTPSDRIAETHAEAMDVTASSRDNAGPQLEQDDFDALPQATAPLAPPEPPPPPPEPIAEETPEEDEGEPLLEAMEVPLEELYDPDTVNEREERPPEEPIRIAQATPTLPQRPSPGRSRDHAGVSKHGVTNFDAIQNEIAPYLKQIRQQVERRWNEMLYTRYSGTSPAKAVIDCAINPQGELVSVSVAGPDGNRIYSALCREAVQRAGPFGAFPFEVPDIYKDKNLEIRWTFNFL